MQGIRWTVFFLHCYSDIGFRIVIRRLIYHLTCQTWRNRCLWQTTQRLHQNRRTKCQTKPLLTTLWMMKSEVWLKNAMQTPIIIFSLNFSLQDSSRMSLSVWWSNGWFGLWSVCNWQRDLTCSKTFHVRYWIFVHIIYCWILVKWCLKIAVF